MDNITSKDIRNICLLGHGGSGKTSLCEAMLYFTKAINRLGKISEGNTVCDYDSEEIKRGITISASMAPVYYGGKKINFIDTPGYLDYVGEVKQALRVARNTVIVVNGKSGVEVGTDIAWDNASEAKVSRSFFVTRLDESGVNFHKIIEKMRRHYGNIICPLYVPYIENDKVVCYIDMINDKAYTYDGKGTASPVDMPAAAAEENAEYKNMLFESLAETSDELMEKFFAEEPFTHEEVVTALNKGISNGKIAPVFSGSAVNLDGIDFFLDIIAKAYPNPIEGVKEKDSDGEVIEVLDNGPAKLFVWKTVADQFVGKMSYVKVMSGVLHKEDMLTDLESGTVEKVVHMYHFKGSERESVNTFITGDIGVLTKLYSINTNDTLTADPSFNKKYRKIKFPKPYLCMATVPKAKGDEDKISNGIAKLLEEDKTIKFKVNPETKQMLLYGLGEQHLDITISKLKNRFGTTVTLEPEKIAYRETIKKSVKVQGKHKKQSGGHGQYGDVHIEFSPGEEEGLVFTESVVGGAVPKNFFPAVEKGLLESMQKGVLAGYPVVKIKANLFDGSYHDVDSSEMSFKVAAGIAFRDGIAQANPVLLEPVGTLKVIVPEKLMGDVMGDLPKRRGKILDSGTLEGKKNFAFVEAEVPQSEMSSYTVALRALSQGRGSFTYDVTGYAEVPGNIAQKIIEESKKAKEE